MLYTRHERLTWVLKGSNRRDIYYSLLENNLTLIELSEKTGITYSNVFRVVRDFLNNELLEDITPNYNNSHLYSLTVLALEFKSEFQKHYSFQKNKNLSQ